MIDRSNRCISSIYSLGKPFQKRYITYELRFEALDILTASSQAQLVMKSQ